MNSVFANKTSFAQKSKLIYEKQKQKLGTNKKETKSKNEKKKKTKKSALTEANKTLQFLSS